jgi:hypothetical protein
VQYKSDRRWFFPKAPAEAAAAITQLQTIFPSSASQHPSPRCPHKMFRNAVAATDKAPDSNKWQMEMSSLWTQAVIVWIPSSVGVHVTWVECTWPEIEVLLDLCHLIFSFTIFILSPFRCEIKGDNGDIRLNYSHPSQSSITVLSFPPT